MKNFKKMMAIVIVAVMTLMYAVPAMADTAGDLTPDSQITITGLDKGDVVHLYQILKWGENDGWTLQTNPDYSALTTSGDPNYCQKVKDLVDNKPNVNLDRADLEKIANVVKANGGPVDTSAALETPPYTYNTTQAPGMYIALVTPGQAGVIYNPIVVSSDFSGTPNTSEIDASNSNMGTSSIAKKENITVTKVAEELDQADNSVTDGTSDETNNSHDVGDIVKFTINTTIPAYSTSYTDPKFTISDSLSKGLTLVVGEYEGKNYDFSIESGSIVTNPNPYVKPNTGATSFTVDFKSKDTEQSGLTPSTADSIAELTDYQDVTITYYAIIGGDAATNVTEEENTVTVTYSNNPQSDSSYGILKDKTKHYTFTIDGKLLGETAYKNSELVKVGVDTSGNPIEAVIKESNGSSQAALEGAVFKLYSVDVTNMTDAEAETHLYKNDKFDGSVTSDAQGLMFINGLDEGDYYLKEITAPKGYIKNNKVWHINVDATIEDEDTTEELNGQKVTYKVPVLKSYTITIDGGATSTFTATISGSQVLTSTSKSDVSTSIANTKGTELPSTGGMGTTLFYIIGAILVILAGVLLVTRRRASVEK